MVDSSDSILLSTKSALGLAADYTTFDPEIIMHINSAISVLTQLGIGPTDGYIVEDENNVWDEFDGGDKTYRLIRTFVYLKTKLVFDPPDNGYTVTAIEKQLEELSWRINIAREIQLPEPAPVVPTDPYDPFNDF